MKTKNTKRPHDHLVYFFHFRAKEMKLDSRDDPLPIPHSFWQNPGF